MQCNGSHTCGFYEIRQPFHVERVNGNESLLETLTITTIFQKDHVTMANKFYFS